jgi:hypothetical protein
VEKDRNGPSCLADCVNTIPPTDLVKSWYEGYIPQKFSRCCTSAGGTRKIDLFGANLGMLNTIDGRAFDVSMTLVNRTILLFHLHAPRTPAFQLLEGHYTSLSCRAGAG